MFEDDGSARTKLLSHLGFSVPAEEKENLEDVLSQEVNAISLEDSVTNRLGDDGGKEVVIFAADNGEDFFNNLPSPKADTPISTSSNTFAVASSVPSVQETMEEVDELEESFDPSFDDSIQCALVVGDYKGAVAQCISANRMVDALVIAHIGGASLWENTRDRYLKVVFAMVNNDLLSLVNTEHQAFEVLERNACSSLYREEVGRSTYQINIP